MTSNHFIIGYSRSQGEVAISQHHVHIRACVHVCVTHIQPPVYLLTFRVSVISLYRVKFSGDFTLHLFLSSQCPVQDLEYSGCLIQRNYWQVMMTLATKGKARGYLSVSFVPSIPWQSPYFGLLSTHPAFSSLPSNLFMLLLNLVSTNQIYNV